MPRVTTQATKHRFIIAFLLSVILLFAGGIVYLISVNQSLKDASKQIQLMEESAVELVAELGTHIILPKDQEPSVATVVNVEKLRESNAEFYRDAQNGDYLVLYEDRAILYRDPEQLIVNVGGVVVTPEAPAPDESDPAQP